MTCLAPKITALTWCFIGGHDSVRLDAMLQAVQLPAGIAHLHACLTHMDRDNLTLNLWLSKWFR